MAEPTNVQEVEPWIANRFGPVAIAEAAGVFVAVVPVYRGVAIGLGSSRLNAVCDLYLDLCADDRRELVMTNLAAWEVERRTDRARRKGWRSN